MKRLVDKLSYANIVASIALFVSLGGASYAAVTLPANSIGPRQLQHNAVGLSNLRFPLGTVGFTNNTPETLASICGPLSNITPPIVVPSGAPGREVAVSLPRAGSLAIFAIAGLAGESAVQTPVPIALQLFVDLQRVVVDQVTVTGEQRYQVPVQAVKRVSAGKHMVGLAAEAENCLNGPGHVRLTHVSLIASASPEAAAHK